MSEEDYDKLRRIFQLFDKDKRGYVGTSELNTILEKMGIHLDKENQNVLLQRYDDNHNGKLGEDQFWYGILYIGSKYTQVRTVN